MTDSEGVARPHLRRSDLRRMRDSLAAGKVPDASPLAVPRVVPMADAAPVATGTILTVCTGNICRSPMAEVLLRSGLAGLPIRVHSAGTHALVDHEMTAPAQEIAAERGADADAAAAAGAVRTLTTAGVDLLGTVVTMLPTKGPDSYGYGSYTYGSTHPTEQADVSLSGTGAKPKRRKPAVSKV